jgi:hypothetical protein
MRQSEGVSLANHLTRPSIAKIPHPPRTKTATSRTFYANMCRKHVKGGLVNRMPSESISQFAKRKGSVNGTNETSMLPSFSSVCHAELYAYE